MTGLRTAVRSDASCRDFGDDAARREAVRRRDPAADGRFVYAVATTGVYCRPSCPSREARRENVAFYADAAAARRAGYRPCLRCRPDGGTAAERHAEAVAAACRAIDAAEAEPRLADLAVGAGMSPHHFHRTFKRLTGVTPKGYAAARRAERLRDGLAGAETVTAAFHDAGYGGSGRFYAEAPAVLGMTPSAYRDGGAKARIRYAIAACSLGHILVAATETGVCAIRFGDDREGLEAELRARFPNADLAPGDAGFARTVAAVTGFVERPEAPLDLPLDVRGTAFQRRVWEALRRIPPGATASYADVAAVIGAPKAVRAVAGACAANPVALAIPCHRVVRGDGALSGYRWGVARKRALLEREAKR
ncbi:MAG: bifunctional DNA-binding transcriptional regulator/O6-methylguanine-DNA methyltransferase Ada [Geminicoccaceae bacterium]|nr:bifunctional DNA-binding transcriptional regulator/O6-methylguanine-DNA methyltransferase Ada [Geminicoccaceae bacterium]